MVLQKTELVRLQLFVKLCYKLASKFRKAEGKLVAIVILLKYRKPVKMSSPVYFEF